VRPERFEHPERGDYAADDGAEGVEGVERGDVLTPGVRVAGGGARRRRERPAHRHGWHREDERAQNQPPGSGHERAQTAGAAAEKIERADDEEQQRREGGGNGHNRFERCIETQGLILPIGPRPKQESADAEAANEDGEDGGGGRSGCAKDEPELPQPGQLVHEGTEARASEQGGNQPGTVTGHRTSWRGDDGSGSGFQEFVQIAGSGLQQRMVCRFVAVAAKAQEGFVPGHVRLERADGGDAQTAEVQLPGHLRPGDEPCVFGRVDGKR
jgi:hypothetical protein